MPHGIPVRFVYWGRWGPVFSWVNIPAEGLRASAPHAQLLCPFCPPSAPAICAGTPLERAQSNRTKHMPMYEEEMQVTLLALPFEFM